MARRLKLITVLLLIALSVSAQQRQRRAKKAPSPTLPVEAVDVPEHLVDIDSNIYKVVKIGKQVWMAENLKVSRLNDGTVIPFVWEDRQWLGLTTPALCWYNDGPYLNDSASYVSTYGFLYNWYAVNTAKLCPEGWHVPSAAEWEELRSFLGGDAGAKMKESGTLHWASTTDEVTNESGFTAIPGGYRNRIRDNPNFTHYVLFGDAAIWWSASQVDKYIATGFTIYAPIVQGRQYAFHGGFRRFDTTSKTSGKTIRCVKD